MLYEGRMSLIQLIQLIVLEKVINLFLQNLNNKEKEFALRAEESV